MSANKHRFLDSIFCLTRIISNLNEHLSAHCLMFTCYIYSPSPYNILCNVCCKIILCRRLILLMSHHYKSLTRFAIFIWFLFSPKFLLFLCQGAFPLNVDSFANKLLSVGGSAITADKPICIRCFNENIYSSFLSPPSFHFFCIACKVS